jgi:hypothetical protein
VSLTRVPDAPSWQASLFDLAITSLVRQHRESFAPLWTVDSWAKLLIWLALSCGCPTDQASMESFAAALPPALTGRMRRVFFGRELEELHLRLLADPAEAEVLALPLDASGETLQVARVAEALERVGLSHRVAPPERWCHHEDLIALPWRQEDGCG